MHVPFLDLATHHAPLRDEFARAFEEVVDSGAFAGGVFVERFEADFAAYCGTRFAIGVASGTDALWLALEALGIGPGDEVITVPMTFIATAEAISRTGATPVFVDIDPVSYTMDPEHLGGAISSRTRAILPVHLFGQMAEMDAILEVAGRHGVPVIEDAAQAHGATYRGARAGSVGRAGCFSFYPGKNLGALGEAGAVVTDCPQTAERVRMLRDHGQSRKYHHQAIGWNSRMDGLQAAILRIKLARLEDHNERRRQHAAAYDEALGGIPELILPRGVPERGHVRHLYPVRVASRDAFVSRLECEGVATGIHYPIPIHLQEAYRFLGKGERSFPVSEACASSFVSLPIFPELTQAQIGHVTSTVRQALLDPQPA